MLGTVRKFWRDQRGVALLLVSIMLPAIIGFSLLAIDMSRVNNLHADLQKAADAMSLAAAAELDGQSDSITRANRAIANLVANNYTFSTAGPPQILQQSGITTRYLKSLPVNDTTAVATSMVITDEVTDAALARFVEVTVTPVGFSAIFPVSYISSTASGSFNVGAKAIAGFSTSVCDYTPVFICNPYEGNPGGVSLEMAAQQRQYRRRQIILRNNGAWQNGNFSFLASPDGNGANQLELSLARVKPSGCYAQDGVDTEPGQNAGPVQDGLNARFGISKSYIGTANGPALNVRMGLKSFNCNNKTTFETDPTKGIGLEEDPCISAGNCTLMGGRMGEGNWNLARYWSANHPTRGALPSALSGTGNDLPTRYETYRYEIDPNGDGNTSDNIIGDASVGGETGNPSCSQTPVTTVDRRILYGAIIDCTANGFNGRATSVPVHAFGSFFITEPIKDGKDIYVELVDITGKGGRGTLDNFLRDEAQIYR
ncbi:hypothetical protein FJ987_24295 [Mesorhizobium sp. CU2]|uniref:pilus assembly protein TadG-related protein n=1 Tax=unclassified Mesorhizobium TaxID=325217 RepID=UPI00112C5514|nr:MULTISPECIES: pilus assembly protein TadG-related protein [unclassified Mesorhizobium]TPN89361.1 hypothetical protein FJ988_00085 [Mesorhizobium sp. CU3]TPO07498.1 hypothetical protein FJ987_24295 [Mesorhizobium sp. CU2]